MSKYCPIKDIGDYIIQTLYKLENKDELTMFLDRKKYNEILDIQKQIEIYANSRREKFIEEMNKQLNLNFPEICKDGKYKFYGTGLTIANDNSDLYVFSWIDNDIILNFYSDKTASKYRYSINNAPEFLSNFTPLLLFLINNTKELMN